MSDNPENKATLFAKMAKVMGGLSTFGKDARNKFHNYDYVSAAQVTQTIGRAMANEGIAFFSSTVGMQTTEDNRYIVEYEYTFACCETGVTMASRWFGEAVHTTSKGALDDKAINKAATTALKYFLLNTFVVSSSDDVDTDANQNQSKPKSWVDTDKKQIEDVKTTLADLIEIHGEETVTHVKATLNPRQFMDANAYLNSLISIIEREQANIEAAEGQLNGSLDNKPPTQETLLEPDFADGLNRGQERLLENRRKKVIEYFQPDQSGEETMRIASNLKTDWLNTESEEIIRQVEAHIALGS
jgi:hypothetical protein